MSVVPAPPRISSSDKTWKQWSSGIEGHRCSLRYLSCCPPGISDLQRSAIISLPLRLGVSLWLLCRNWDTRTHCKATFSWSGRDILLSGALLNPRKHHREQRLHSDGTGFCGLTSVLSPARSISFESWNVAEPDPSGFPRILYKIPFSVSEVSEFGKQNPGSFAH